MRNAPYQSLRHVFPLPGVFGPVARHLPCGVVEAVEEVSRGNHEDQSRQPSLVVIACGLLPDRVWNRVGLVGKSGDGFGEREGSTLGIGEVGSLPPGGNGEEPLIRFTRVLSTAGARVNAEATAINLAGPQVNKLKRLRRHIALSGGLDERLYGGCGLGQDCGGVAHSWLHGFSPSAELGFGRDGSAHPHATEEPVSCHVGVVSHVNMDDGTRPENVTGGRIGMAGGTVRDVSDASARGSLPDAGHAGRGGGRRAETSGIENLDGWLTTVVAPLPGHQMLILD
jgi:hypothetical protein